jgi:conserved repeat domain
MWTTEPTTSSRAPFIPAAAGVYSYAVRFDGNWGPGNPSAGWTYGDLDGVHPTEPFELDQCGVLTVLAPSLSVAKSVAPQADVPPGGVVTYTVVLSNSGAGNALGVVLTDALPAEVTFGGWVQQPSGAIYENGIITWTGTVTGGTEVTLVFTATLGTDSGLYNRTVVNTARFVSDTAGSGSAQATFATARRYWVYLPLVMRNWRP